MQTRVPRKKPWDPAPRIRQETQRQLGHAVDADGFQHRDPLWHVTENFQESFDRIGRRRAAQLTLEGADEDHARNETAERTPQASTETPDRRETPAGRGATRHSGRYHPELAESPLHTFAETAFQRGNLAAAVLQGSGRMMLATCLKRSLGQSEPLQQRQTLFGTGSQVRMIPGSPPDQMVFHRGFAESAVGLVVDVLSDARAMVDTMTQMAMGCGDLKESEGAATLRRVYPFLDDSRERELLEAYRTQLKGAVDPRERPALQNALVHTRALMARKEQMKAEFISKLRWISDRAQEALEELEGEDTLEYLTAALRPEADVPPPEPPAPPDEPGRRETDHAAAEPPDRDEFQEPDRPAGVPEEPTAP